MFTFISRPKPEPKYVRLARLTMLKKKNSDITLKKLDVIRIIYKKWLEFGDGNAIPMWV